MACGSGILLFHAATWPCSPRHQPHPSTSATPHVTSETYRIDGGVPAVVAVVAKVAPPIEVLAQAEQLLVAVAPRRDEMSGHVEFRDVCACVLSMSKIDPKGSDE